jgi:hypothetical protein
LDDLASKIHGWRQKGEHIILMNDGLQQGCTDRTDGPSFWSNVICESQSMSGTVQKMLLLVAAEKALNQSTESSKLGQWIALWQDIPPSMMGFKKSNPMRKGTARTTTVCG